MSENFVEKGMIFIDLDEVLVRIRKLEGEDQGAAKERCDEELKFLGNVVAKLVKDAIERRIRKDKQMSIQSIWFKPPRINHDTEVFFPGGTDVKVRAEVLKEETAEDDTPENKVESSDEQTHREKKNSMRVEIQQKVLDGVKKVYKEALWLPDRTAQRLYTAESDKEISWIFVLGPYATLDSITFGGRKSHKVTYAELVIAPRHNAVQQTTKQTKSSTLSVSDPIPGEQYLTVSGQHLVPVEVTAAVKPDRELLDVLRSDLSSELRLNLEQPTRM